ncbi:hypothetical protein EC973_006868 [Apophysomyces ossiformis]|uniref:DNA mismatch repair protein S5 domain-containing protein n=1 Tax=Apophysomyces ossiformis TaxID=679940 RepID=A0A8H7BQK9_9FUNG|nr:hypothetical protein EC973_006868 [Apophysomyces ossiformis]
MVARQYDFDHEGSIVCEKVATGLANAGTVVSVHEPFRNIPVRRQVAQKNAATGIKRIQDLLVRFSLSHPNTRFSLQQAQDTLGSRRETTWIKPAKDEVMDSISAVYGAQLADALTCGSVTEDGEGFVVDYVLPKPSADAAVIYKSDRIFVFVNGRAINYTKSDLKEMVAMIRKRCRDTFSIDDSSKKMPFVYIHIKAQPDQYDVNIEPSKNVVLFHRKQHILNLVETILDKVYGSVYDRLFNGQRYKEGYISTEKEALVQSYAKDRLTGNTEAGKTSSEIDPNLRRQVNAQPGYEQTPRADQRNYSGLNDEYIGLEDETEPTPVFPEERSAAAQGVPSLSDWLASKQTSYPTEHNGEKIAPDKTTSNDTMEWQIEQFQPELEATDTDFNERAMNAQEQVICVPRDSTLENDATDANQDYREHVQAKCCVLPEQTRKVQSINATDRIAPVQRSERIDILRQLGATPNLAATHNIQRPIPPAMQPSSQVSTSESREISLASPITRVRKRNIPHILLDHSTRKKAACETFGEESTLSFSIDRVKTDYALCRARHSKLYRCRFEDWPLRAVTERGAVNVLSRSLEKDLAVYSRVQSTVQLGRVVGEIGVVDMKRQVTLACTLMDRYELIPHKTLERPIQMQLSESDPLYAVLLTLTGYEQQIEDDHHGCKDCNYHIVDDRYVIANGFSVRWRKCSHLNVAIVQLTAAYDLDEPYGLSDFCELLSLMKANTQISLNKVRPAKVVNYCCRLAERETPIECDTDSVKDILDARDWKDQPLRDGRQVSLAADRQVLACLLWSSQQDRQQNK